MKYKLIACINSAGAIGRDGNLMYNIKSDLRNFRSQTMGNVVIMGRKTFESLPNGKPLAGRVNIILTSDREYSVPVTDDDLYIVHSIADADELCEAFFSDRELFVIGGGEVYRDFLDNGMVDEMRISSVKDDAEGDTYFPYGVEDLLRSGDWRTYYKSMAQVTNFNGVENTYHFLVLKRTYNGNAEQDN